MSFLCNKFSLSEPETLSQRWKYKALSSNFFAPHITTCEPLEKKDIYKKGSWWLSGLKFKKQQQQKSEPSSHFYTEPSHKLHFQGSLN